MAREHLQEWKLADYKSDLCYVKVVPHVFCIRLKDGNHHVYLGVICTIYFFDRQINISMYMLQTFVFIVIVVFCFGYRNYEIRDGRKIFDFQDGSVMGTNIVFHDKNLGPVERIPGIAYATTRGKRLRLMPPTGPLEKWLDVRVAINNRPPCPQTLYTGNDFPNLSVPGRSRVYQNFTFPEECHSLNLYIPKKGRFYLISFPRLSYKVQDRCIYLHICKKKTNTVPINEIPYMFYDEYAVPYNWYTINQSLNSETN